MPMFTLASGPGPDLALQSRAPAAVLRGKRQPINDPKLQRSLKGGTLHQNRGRGMWRLGALAGRLLVLSLAVGLAGCSTVDRYSGHAVIFNVEAEQAQDQVLLLNVVRAYLRRPMQFTTLDNITGTTTVQGTAQVTVPPWQGMFNGQVNSGPTYSVPVLDTQDFYEGILSPVPAQLIDLYIQQGYSRDLIYNLFLQKIVVRRTDCRPFIHTHDCELTFRNYVHEDLDLDLFQTLLGYLIRIGLTTEALPEPPKEAVDSADHPTKTSIRLAGDPPSSGLELAGNPSGLELVSDKPDKKKKKKREKDGGDDGEDGSTTKLKPYRFCFAPHEPAFYWRLNRAVLCDNPASAIKSKRGKTTLSGVPIAAIAERLHKIVLDRMVQSAEGWKTSGAEGFIGIGEFAKHPVSLQFYTRSAEGIIYYLGEVARRQNEHPERPFVEFRSGPPSNRFPVDLCPFEHPENENGYECNKIFVLEQNSAGPAALAVYYEGSRYSIPGGNDRSMAVLDFTRQVLAVNTSAKQLPASSVLRVVGGR
jgi:hypothetical protein